MCIRDSSFTDRGHNVHSPDGTEIYPDIISEMVNFLFENIGDSGTTLSTSEINKTQDSGFVIFPNPVSHSLNINDPKKEFEQIEVRTLQGELVFSTQKSPIDVSKLSIGTYILIAKGDFITYSTLFVKY